MGMQSIISGYILEAHPGCAADGDPEKAQKLIDIAAFIVKENSRVISSLPEADSWPCLPKSMFSQSSDPAVTYWNTPIHFAACMNQLDFDLKLWFEKFEKLLASMYWEKVIVHFEGAHFGYHTFGWHPKREWVSNLCSGKLEPIKWDFTGTLDPADH